MRKTQEHTAHLRRPQAVSIDTATTAVVVVDMQNDFGTKGGMFDRAGIDISGIQKAVGPTANVLDLARTAGIRIGYLKMAYRPDLSDLERLTRSIERNTYALVSATASQRPMERRAAS